MRFNNVSQALEHSTFVRESRNATRLAGTTGRPFKRPLHHHGFFEALQGNRPTSGLIIQAIGPSHRWCRAWMPSLVASTLLFLAALEISVFGVVPGVTEPDTVLAICWSLLLASLVLLNVAYVAGFARDIDRHALVNSTRSSVSSTTA